MRSAGTTAAIAATRNTVAAALTNVKGSATDTPNSQITGTSGTITVN